MKELSEAAKLSERYRKTRPVSRNSVANRRPVFGVGNNDSDYVTSRHGADFCPAYQQWVNILTRCYSSAAHKKDPSYIGCSVSTEWRSFMAFRGWWIANHRDGLQLDKDMLVLGNRIYGPETCVFVTRRINSLFGCCGADMAATPTGVSFIKKSGRFMAKCGNGEEAVYLGTFALKSEAHLAWRDFKLGVIEELRAEMDAIDPRIYVNAKAKIMSHAEHLNL